MTGIFIASRNHCMIFHQQVEKQRRKGKNMITFVPAMNFNGQCREAMEMYRDAFGGKVTALLTYGEVNDPAYTLTEEQKNWIYHCELTFGDQRIIMSDHVDMHFVTCYTNFLTVMMDTKEQVAAAWETMKEGSTVIYPLQSTFYSSARVVFDDRFGIRWGIMTETAE